MKVGWIGLGKLGLPCALTLEHYGDHEIMGFDPSDRVRATVESRVPPTVHERDLDDLLLATQLKLGDSVGDVVAHTDDFIFVAVQTPHDPRYGGELPMPVDTADFDYTYLRAVAREVNLAAATQNKHITMVVISTALPGTVRREVMPLLSDFVTLVYNPFFIAMGTTVNDYVNPEFVLVGTDNPDSGDRLRAFYEDFYTKGGLGTDLPPVLVMTPEEAELTKVSYNTYISLKIVFANTLLEITDKLGVNVDVVTDALGRANRRLISTAYMRGGVGDGGACHPRDNIAMSWLATELGLAVDPFEFVTRAREAQSEWLVSRVLETAQQHGLPIVVLGKAYKPESDLVFGSPAALFVHQLHERGETVLDWWDPYIDDRPPLLKPAVYVVMTKHDEFTDLAYPAGSVVIDPHRYVPLRSEVDVEWLGGN